MLPTADIALPASAYARCRRRWLEARKQGLGASDTAAVLGLNDHVTPLDVWFDKTSPVVEDGEVSEAAEWGSHLEDSIARKAVARHRGVGKLVPSPGLLRSVDHPWMLATVDRLLVRRGVPKFLPQPDPHAILEVKTTSEWNFRSKWDQGVPLAIQIQCQQQLAVTGLDHLYVAVLVAGQRMPLPYRVERDELAIAQIIEYAGRWWHDHVVAGVRPEPSFGDRDTLHTIWPGIDSDTITADQDLESAYYTLMDARARRKELQAAEDKAAFLIKTAMRDATCLLDATGEVLATWKPVTSTRIDTTALKRDHPDIAAQYSKTTTTRRFTLRETHDD